MSTIDKRIYLDALRQRLGDVVTANDMERVLKVADDVLIDFDIHSVGQMGEDMDSEQLLEFYLMQLEVRGCAPGTEGIDAKDADYWRQIQIPEPPEEET